MKSASSARGTCAWRSLFCTNPTPDTSLAQLEDHSHPAWQRLKAEELLAQQLSQWQARRAREHLRAPVLQRRARRAARSAAGGAAVSADRRAAARGGGDRARPGAPAAHAPPAAGRRGQRQDGGGRAGRRQRHRRRLAVRADGAHRNPGRAALCQAGRLAGAAARPARPAGGLAHRRPEEEARAGHAGRPSSNRARRRWWWARTPSSRPRCALRAWAWPSSTSSTVLACSRGWTCATSCRSRPSGDELGSRIC
jgi:hypothetical protein